MLTQMIISTSQILINFVMQRLDSERGVRFSKFFWLNGSVYSVYR